MGMWRDVEAYLQRLVGTSVTEARMNELRAMTLRDAVQTLLDEGVGGDADEVIASLDARVLDFYSEQVRPKPGAIAFVSGLDAAGVPCAIVSSSPRRYLEAGLGRAGILPHITAILSVDDIGQSKHGPRIFEMACERLGDLDPHDVWGADDSLYAIEVMSSLGISTIGTYDYDDAGSYAELTDAATIAVRSLAELDPADFA